MGGEADPDGYPSVGRAGGRGICGGTLITPQHVLTAAHCVEVAVPTHVDFGAEVGDPSLRVPVAGCAVHPRYNELARPRSTVTPALTGVPLEDRCAAFSTVARFITDEMSRYDVAVLELARPVPGAAAGSSPFVPIDPTPRWSPTSAAESFVAVGFGEGSEVRGGRQAVAVSVARIDDWLIPSTVLRPGDSGGPLFGITADGPRVLGVASSQGSWVNVSVSPLATWIDSIVAPGGGSAWLCGGRTAWQPELSEAEDEDRDGVREEVDVCPGVFNPCQRRDDRDADGVPDECDACPLDPSITETFGVLEDEDDDGTPDVCDCRPAIYDPREDSTVDGDGDLIPTACDVCPSHFDPEQSDRDDDGRGDACDRCPDVAGEALDRDGDGVPDACDNCPGTSNPVQGNCNLDAELAAGLASFEPGRHVYGRGDACDPVPCGETHLAHETWTGDDLSRVTVSSRVEVDGRSSERREARTGFRFCGCDAADGNDPATRSRCIAEGCEIDDRLAYLQAESLTNPWRRLTIDDLATERLEATAVEMTAEYGPSGVDLAGSWDVEADVRRWESLWPVPDLDALRWELPGVLWTYAAGPVGSEAAFDESVARLAHHYWSGPVVGEHAMREAPGCLRYVGPFVAPRTCTACEGSFPAPFVALPFSDRLCGSVAGAPVLELPGVSRELGELLGIDLGPVLARDDVRWIAASEPLSPSDRSATIEPRGLTLVAVADGRPLLRLREGAQGIRVDGASPCAPGQCEAPTPILREARDVATPLSSLATAVGFEGPTRFEAATSVEVDESEVWLLSARRQTLFSVRGDAGTRRGMLGRRILLDDGGEVLLPTVVVDVGRVLAATYDARTDALYVLDEVVETSRRWPRARARLVRIEVAERFATSELASWPRLSGTSEFQMVATSGGDLVVAASAFGAHTLVRLTSAEGGWRASHVGFGIGTLADVAMVSDARGLSFVTRDFWGRAEVRGVRWEELRRVRLGDLSRCF